MLFSKRTLLKSRGKTLFSVGLNTKVHTGGFLEGLCVPRTFTTQTFRKRSNSFNRTTEKFPVIVCLGK